MSIFNSSLVVQSAGIGAGMVLIGGAVVSVALIPCVTGVVMTVYAIATAHHIGCAIFGSLSQLSLFFLTHRILSKNQTIHDLQLERVRDHAYAENLHRE